MRRLHADGPAGEQTEHAQQRTWRTAGGVDGKQQ